MDILETRRCNTHCLVEVECYLSAPKGQLLAYYEELLGDQRLLHGLNASIADATENHGFRKGIFAKGAIDSIDWFAFQRTLLYVLVRHLKPKVALETGVYYGGNTAFLLAALERNGGGQLLSVDLPDARIRDEVVDAESGTPYPRHPMVGDSELYSTSLKPGFIVPDYLRGAWSFVEGDSRQAIQDIVDPIDFYLHDSDHSHDFVVTEMTLAIDRMRADGCVVVDDINWSNGFFQMCVTRRLHPLLLTDNGKANLSVRTGLLRLDHPNNGDVAMSGGGTT
jgi:predicted O-methyltransferase YrrM